jgi:predicted enzyme related to lactoylglutathione lyase
MSEKIEFLSAVLLVSRDAARLASFYREVLGVPLVEEQHDDTLPHWGCTLGDLHFAIHPVEDYPEDPTTGVGAIKLAFAVFDIDAAAAKLEERGVDLVYAPKDLGWCKMTAIRDPDGNYIELTELGDDWFRHLEKRKVAGHDLVLRKKKLEALNEEA